MKSIHKYFTCSLLLLAFHASQRVHVGPRSWLKRVGRAAIGKVPVVGEAINSHRLEEKVDHIQTKQKTGLDKLQDLAKEAKNTKKKVEEMYYFKEQSRRRAEELVKGLQRGKTKNLLGVLVERWIGVPINPADYIPICTPPSF